MVAPDLPEVAVAKTRDGLVIHHRLGTSDIKAIREACANLLEEQKRTPSYLRVRSWPKFLSDIGDTWLDLGAHIRIVHVAGTQEWSELGDPRRAGTGKRCPLKRNLEENDMVDRCTLETCAVVGEKNFGTEEVPLYRTKSTYRHTLIPVKNFVDVVPVRMVTLTELLEKYPTVNSVKLDIEGNEKSVLESLNWKSRNVRIKKLVFEYSFDHHPEMDDFHDLVDFLKRQFAIVYHHASIPARGQKWNKKITRGANGRLVWCCGKLS